MKPETNNEIDLLLRRLGRREGASTSAADHLDADELSSYAENALPATARALYTEHLAECSRCREFVVQLSSSVGVVAAEETARALPVSGFRKFLASLFSPLVLRYAIPAVGLIVVAAIGFLVLRSNRSETFVAQLERRDENQPAAAAVPNEQSPAPASGDTNEPHQIAESYGTRQKSQTRTTNEAPASAPAPQPAKTARFQSEPPAPTPTPEQQAAANAAPTAQPTPKPAGTGDMRVDIESRAQSARSVATDAAKQRSYDTAKAEEKRTEDLRAAQSRPPKAPAPGTGSVAGLMRDGEREKDKDDAETRTVGGRRFRKQRGVWVDVAYSGSETTNISRGSEQYRALIADEPGIKSIAEQLDGPIIVVWKGRAYRIR